MKYVRRFSPVLFVVMFATMLVLMPQAMFATDRPGTPASVRITQPIDEHQLVTLARHTFPLAMKEYDRGRVSDNWEADHILMILQRSPEKEQELVRYIDSLNDKTSPNFHHWLTAAEFGEKYGVAQQDVERITGWLESHGFRVNQVFTSRMMIDFSGTAGSIREAFHTEIHQLDVKGQMHFANMSNPQIPAALAPVLNGIYKLNDFKGEPQYRPARDYTFAGCATSSTDPAEPGTCYAVTPQDNAVIYSLNPLWSAGISGQGQTIALIEDSNTYTAGTPETTDSDWSTYRSTFGLSGYSSTYSTVHPNGCTDPGANADDGEAAIDVEMASSFAPSANIELVSCASSGFVEGTALAVANLVNAGGPYPGVLSMSYGLCEAATGNGGTAYYYNAFEQAAAQGISAFASSGDAGTGQCGNIFNGVGSEYNVTSLAVTGWGESPFNVSVGGTDFEDTYNSKTGQNGGAALSTYWNQTNPSVAPYGSALRYVPEIPWNDACGSTLIAAIVNGSPFTNFVPYGTSGACNKTPGNTTYEVLGAGAGGASSCATGNGGTAQEGAAASDTYCQGYPKPSYQSGSALLNGKAVYGSSSDGVRDVPDVSMFASNGPWGHFETVCWSDPSETAGGATPCSGLPSTWAGFGGTSVAAPSMAAIQALVNQKTGQSWGNPNPVYYQIAQNEYGVSGGTFQGSSCNASGSGGPADVCVFNDVTQGDNDVACEDDGTTAESHCYKPSGTLGVDSTDTISGTTILTGGTGYTSAPTCIIAGPSNNNPYLSPTGATLYAGGTQATCTAAFNSGSTTGTYTIKFIATGTTINADYPNQLGFLIGGVTYTFVSSLSGAPANSVLLVTSGSTNTQETDNAKNLAAAITANSSFCTVSPCFGTGTTANPLATAADPTSSTLTITAKTAGYAGNFSVSYAATDVIFQQLEVTTITQTIAASGPGYVSSIAITAAGSGYAPQTPVTFSGTGSGALAVANTNAGTASSSYQPAYGAAPGYDLATGLGSVNANNMVESCSWVTSSSPGINSPSTGSTITGPVETFCWGPVAGATNYWLDAGRSYGDNYYEQSGPLGPSTFSLTVNDFPNDGSTIYVTFWYFVGGSWQFTEYEYIAEGGTSCLGNVTSPTPGGILPATGAGPGGTGGAAQVFGWTPSSATGCAAAVTGYWLDAGEPGTENFYYQSGQLSASTTSNTAYPLPTAAANGPGCTPVFPQTQCQDPSTVTVTLFTLINGSWQAAPTVSYTYAPN